MRTTTRLALAFFAAVVLALTIYAYPSWAGFSTLAFRAISILAMLVLAALLLASLTHKRPGRFDIILVLASIGVIIASWSQVSAVMDAHKLDAEIAEAGEGNLMSVLAATTTNTGSLVRAANELRDTTNNGIVFDVDSLWDEDRFAALIGPLALDDAELAQAADRVTLLSGAVDQTRGQLHDILDAEIESITKIETPLPDSERLTFVDAAVQRVETDRTYFSARLDLAGQRLATAADIVTLLQNSPGAFTFDTATRTLVFDDQAVGTRYRDLVASIDATWTQEEQLSADHDAGELAGVRGLVDAAEVTP